MSSNRTLGFGGALTALTLIALSGCARESSDQMSWARAALERNAGIEIVASDPKTHTFTVRDKASGELRVVHADELVAGAAAGAATPAAAPAAPPAAETAPAATVAATTVPPATTAATNASGAAAASEAPAASSAWRSDQGGSQGGAAAAVPARTTAAAEGDGGRVLESGPGYSIKTAAAVPAPGARLGGGATTTAAVEYRHDPIVCQGARLVQIDNRNLVFDGDAVSAEDGCEIHITNSRITANGVGVSARAASVYVDNSQIEGDAASIDASQGAQIYAEQSRFRGLSRRLDTATFHDLGGNVWN
jgi:hypothetical protein